MSEKIAIEVKDLHIRYKTVKAESIKKSLLSLKKSRLEEFEAVRGLSFSIKKGEIVGLIGKNGSGKSTTLRSIAGIFSADEGSIDIGDNTISLLAIGVGFNKELTGKDNIYLSGLLLGFTHEEIKAKYKEIVKFSELGKFVNAPVRTYSSGMYSKLAFSITAVLETDIILIDEVLSVGDINFKKKSLKKMKELINDSDRTVMIVSHSIETIRKLCTRVIWIHEGQMKMDGETEEVLAAYQEFMSDEVVDEKQAAKVKREENLLKMWDEQ
ncbi:MAG: ABC transporter ATP-binding protein [Lachnospiraceae bacterium]|nr:ABC transporter ATP-binding protein [Lachnospiraceae bacterium]